MIRFEVVALAFSKINGGLDDPDSRAFKLKNPLLLKTYRPEKKVDSENYRVFSSFGGGFKAGVADLLAKCDGANHRLSSKNTLRDLLKLYGFSDERAQRKLILFVQRASQDNMVTANTEISWLYEKPVETVVEATEEK